MHRQCQVVQREPERGVERRVKAGEDFVTDSSVAVQGLWRFRGRSVFEEQAARRKLDVQGEDEAGHHCLVARNRVEMRGCITEDGIRRTQLAETGQKDWPGL